MRKSKAISLIIAIVVLCFSFLGLIQLPEVVNKSFSLIRTVIPYPGKTVLMINKFLKYNPYDNSAHTHKTTTDNQKRKNRFSGILFYILSSVLVCNEKSFLLLLIVLAGLSVRCFNSEEYNCRDVFAPPDMQFFRQCRLKFITPIEKCIQNLVEMYDINPINMYGWALCASRKNPHFVNEQNAGFFYVCENG